MPRRVNCFIGDLYTVILELMVLLLFVLEKSRFLAKSDAAPWVLAHVGHGTCVEVFVLFFVDFLGEFSKTKSALKSLDFEVMGILVSVLAGFGVECLVASIESARVNLFLFGDGLVLDARVFIMANFGFGLILEVKFNNERRSLFLRSSKIVVAFKRNNHHI